MTEDEANGVKEQIQELTRRLSEAGLQVTVVYSSLRHLDVLEEWGARILPLREAYELLAADALPERSPLSPAPSAVPEAARGYGLLTETVAVRADRGSVSTRQELQEGARYRVTVTGVASLGDGVHTIAWSVIDNLGAARGIGSRYFTVSNGAAGLTEGPLSGGGRTPRISSPRRGAAPASCPRTPRGIPRSRGATAPAPR